MKITKYFILLWIVVYSCNVEKVLDCNLRSQVLCETTYEELLELNKQIIPCLIDSIDINGKTLVGFRNPMSSKLEEWAINQKGIKYAYYIDYILSKQEIVSIRKTWNDSEDILHWEELISPYRIYTFGTIIKYDKNNNITYILTHKDMILIKKMYYKWWQKNKKKSIKILRHEFQQSNKILQFPYKWM